MTRLNCFTAAISAVMLGALAQGMRRIRPPRRRTQGLPPM
jgi:hypothetical protein